MGDYKKTAVTVAITLAITAVFNFFWNQGASYFKDTPKIEMKFHHIDFPIAVPLALVDENTNKDILDLIKELDKPAYKDIFISKFIIERVKEFSERRKAIASSPSEKIIQRISNSASLSYTSIIIKNDTNSLLNDISIITPQDELLFETNFSENKNYTVEIEGNKGSITKLAPGEIVSLFSTSRPGYFINEIRVLHDAEILPIRNMTPPNYGPIYYLVYYANGGIISLAIILSIFFAGIILIITIMIAVLRQIFNSLKQEPAKGSDT